MDDEIYIDDPNVFENDDVLYEFLLALQEENVIGDLTELLQFFLNHERLDFYLTVKRFIANDLET